MKPSDEDLLFTAEMMLANAEDEASDDANNDADRQHARCEAVIAEFFLKNYKPAPKAVVEVFSRPECVFNYCPHPQACKDACINHQK